MWGHVDVHLLRMKRTADEEGRLLGGRAPHGTPSTSVRDLRTTMVIGRFSQRDMREVNVSSIRTYRQIRAPATNQWKRKSAMFRNKRQPAPPVKTGLMSKVKRCSGPRDNRRRQ
jgi:hypothetical protein